MSRFLKKPIDSTNFVAGAPIRSGGSTDQPAICDGRDVNADVVTHTGAGAVSVNSGTVKIVTTGANALTLANGVDGQTIKLVMITDGGDGTLTPTNKAGYNTITFNDVGDTCTLHFVNSKWYLMSNYGCTVA